MTRTSWTSARSAEVAFDPQLVARDQLLTSRVFAVEHLRFTVDGEVLERDVVRHPGAVAVVAYEAGKVVLVRQWRAALQRFILEVPAGTRDVAGEPPAATARRELEEEAGLRAEVVEPLCRILNSPGSSDQVSWLFLATGLTPCAPRPAGPEERAIEVVRLALSDALALCSGDEPVDATTAVALLALAARGA